MENDRLPLRRIDGRRLSHKTSAALRRLATEMVARGERPSAVMSRFGLCRTTIYRWLRAVRQHGLKALAPRPHPGRKPRLSPAQTYQLRAWIIGHRPSEHGVEASLWTCKAVAELARRKFGVTLAAITAGRLLVRLGLRPGPGEIGSPPLDRAGLLFAVGARGAFLCTRLPAPRSKAQLDQAMRALGRQVGRSVRFLLAEDPLEESADTSDRREA